jgi:hypothetical protein
LYKGMPVVVTQTHHKAPYRVQILCETSETGGYIDWVHNSTLTPLEPAVADILNAVHNHKEK